MLFHHKGFYSFLPFFVRLKKLTKTQILNSQKGPKRQKLSEKLQANNPRIPKGLEEETSSEVAEQADSGCWS